MMAVLVKIAIVNAKLVLTPQIVRHAKLGLLLQYLKMEFALQTNQHLILLQQTHYSRPVSVYFFQILVIQIVLNAMAFYQRIAYHVRQADFYLEQRVYHSVLQALFRICLLPLAILVIQHAKHVQGEIFIFLKNNFNFFFNFFKNFSSKI